jgi:AbrB family looped-hinge helix DNA binding protein
MASWREMVNAAKRPTATKVSRNGQVVLPAKARRAAGIQPGDLVRSVPVGPGLVLIEKVRAREGQSLREFYESPENPLRGVWGPDPDAWLDELRGQWQERQTS